MWPQHRYPCSPLPLSLARDQWLPLCFVAVGVRTVALPARYRSCGSVACMASRGVRSFENSPFHWDLCLIFLFLVLAFSIFQNSLLCS